MNRNEAKLILEVSRSGDEAAADPQLAAALTLAQTDAELAAWLERERRWDAVVRRELQTVPVPADLRANLLARPKLAPLPVAKSPPNLFAWHAPVLWALAAVLVLFVGLAAFWSLGPAAKRNRLADFTRDMIAASPDDTHHVDVMNNDFAKVKSWLGDRHALADIELPPAIKNAPGLMGCRIMSWHGQSVSMLCFLMSGSRHVDLFVTAAASIADAPAPGQPVFASFDQNATAGWRVGDNVYVMAGQVPEEFLRHCLDPSANVLASRPLALERRL